MLYAEGYPEDYNNARQQGEGPQTFDDAYAIALAAAQAAAGPPLLSGIDDGNYRFRWALRRGETGLFAVWQSYPDVLDGVIVIEYCVIPWAGGDPQPGPYFEAWIVRQLNPQ